MNGKILEIIHSGWKVREMLIMNAQMERFLGCRMLKYICSGAGGKGEPKKGKNIW